MPERLAELQVDEARQATIWQAYPAGELQERLDAAAAELADFTAELAKRRDIPFFVMRADGFGPGNVCSLHLFEPRYRWLVVQTLGLADRDNRPPFREHREFGFITSGRAELGARGIKCKIVRHRANHDGTYDVIIIGTEPFVVQTITAAEVPPMYGGSATVAPLYHGSVNVTETGSAAPHATTSGRSTASHARGLCAVM